ncbi:hypothetical protein ANSO36C_68480 (plasmid) [Nostoc cf. commune SO-36]|uniref:CHAT domain-containing protein n=1 Tax=Nostoc cf. commune SO-36 TaxID=449208 RepID=A0ABM7ZCK7_NOSCO|nr:CHAT domain-containing tetratricopeptide repeat protein [Nostoc commune]BDI21046.1 hypothetical protein ANSO36C_68480 [Nostoc cf. commune SO-36]
MGESHTLYSIALLYSTLNQKNEELDYYQKSLQLSKKINDRRGISSSLCQLGIFYRNMGDKSKAISYLKQCIDLVESVQADIQVEQLKAGFSSNQQDNYVSLIHLLWNTENPEILKEAFSYVERARARAFLDQLANGKLNLKGVSSSLLQQEQQLKIEMRGQRNQLTKLQQQVAENFNQSKVNEVKVKLLELEKKYTDILTQIKLDPKAASLVSVKIPALPEIQKLLDKDTTLVEYFITRGRTFVFIITSDSFQAIPINKTYDELYSAVSGFRKFSNIDSSEPPETLKKLYEWLIIPVQPYLKTKKLIIVPHNTLHYLPFAALSDGNHYLGENYIISTLPTSSALAYLPKKHHSQLNTLLALGNPSISESLSPLDKAEEEVESIGNIYNSTSVFILNDATETRLRVESSTANIIHIAAHGEYNSANPLFSTIYLASDDQNDGLLQVQEIYDLDLTATNLVVLSACNTSVGRLSKGDEVVGLTRAFLYAGAPSVISTLWSVDDTVTGEFMQRFYTHLHLGIEKAEALQKAQNDIRKDYPNPYFWAAFVLTGDGGK